MTVIISGTEGVSDVDGSAGTPAIRGTDANTGIFFGADQVGVATNGVERVEFGNSETVFNDGGANVDFRVEGDTNANLLFVDASADAVGIGTNTPSARLQVTNGGANSPGSNLTGNLGQFTSSGGIAYITFGNGDSANQHRYIGAASAIQVFGKVTDAGVATEQARITSDGHFLVGKTSAVGTTTNGVELRSNGELIVAVNNATPAYINRNGDDGKLIVLGQADVEEGNISVSGNTVSYNAFSGGHWSQLQEGRGYNPGIPRGTVMSTIGEMCLWKSVEWIETIEHDATEEKEAWTESITHRESYLGDLPVGATFEEDGFTKTVVDDGNERLPKVKISDVVGDKAVYGVFQTWDEVQDMLVTSLGAFVVRIAAGVTVEIGDLLESNGDGCAKVQDDDVIRSKTIAKVTSTTPTDTYADGSYTVPAVIYCG